ncbi:hypothetical protein NO221_00080, partial [Gluconacetobacter entanii]|nr:hypothetical protein [Gluconacetobacter entanii]
MTEALTPDVHDILDDHGERIGFLERWRDSADGKIDDTRREVGAIRAEMQAQYAATSSALERQSR